MKLLTTNRMIASATALAVTAFAAVLALTGGDAAHAQQAEGAAARVPQRSAPEAKTLIDPNDAVILLLDHQAGLFQTVKDVPVAELRTNTVTSRRSRTARPAAPTRTASTYTRRSSTSGLNSPGARRVPSPSAWAARKCFTAPSDSSACARAPTSAAASTVRLLTEFDKWKLDTFLDRKSVV